VSWRPLLAAEPDAARVVVARIAEQIAAAPPAIPELANGQAGVAVLFAYLARDEPRWRATSEGLLEAAGDQLEAAATPSLFHGFPGIGWAGDHVRALLGEPDLELNSELDEVLVDYLGNATAFDLVTGLVGIGVYALERGPAGERCLGRVIDRLRDAAAREFWISRDQLPATEHARWPTGRWDLGLAHGTPGAVALLARTEARDLVASALDQLLVHRRSGEVAFPAFASPGEPSSRWVRSGWCYGDAAVALAIARAGRVELAVELARHAARRPLDQTGVIDATFCHGAAGLAQIFGRLHAVTGDGALGDAARFWLAETLRLAERTTAPGLLDGAAGIALVLHAATSDHAPDWDRAFLLG